MPAQRTIRCSAKTGCGATTLLLSHLSQNHTGFAIDVWRERIERVQLAPAAAGVVMFINGSQRILPTPRDGRLLVLDAVPALSMQRPRLWSGCIADKSSTRTGNSNCYDRCSPDLLAPDLIIVEFVEPQ